MKATLLTCAALAVAGVDDDRTARNQLFQKIHDIITRSRIGVIARQPVQIVIQ